MNQCQSAGIGLAGFGTVGSGLWDSLQSHDELIRDRSRQQLPMHIAGILVRDLKKVRQNEVAVPAELFVTDWRALVENPAVDILVELIGGTTLAFDLVAAALRAGKPVVTGNKALIAERGAELFAIAEEMHTPLFFEAAVAGGIPIIRTLMDSYMGNRMTSMFGVINGTSNFILDRMTQSAMSFEDALSEAQRLGYAEADPSLDVNGWDAAHKVLILAMIAQGFFVDPKKIHVSGIEQVRQDDILFAKKLGYVIKLLAIVREHDNGAVEIRVQPSLVPQSHILASVNGVFNAIVVHSEPAGEAMFYGRGAGAGPTSSSVVADVIEAVRTLQVTGAHRGFLPYQKNGNILPVEETVTSYYVRLDVTDRPGVLAEVAQLFARHSIGISGQHSPVNAENPDAAFVDMIILLHRCPFGKLQAALAEISALDCINSDPVVFRIETLT